MLPALHAGAAADGRVGGIVGQAGQPQGWRQCMRQQPPLATRIHASERLSSCRRQLRPAPSTQHTQRPCVSATSSCRTPYRCARLSSAVGKLSVCWPCREAAELNSKCACRGAVGQAARHTAVSAPRGKGRRRDWRQRGRRRACDRAHQRRSIIQWEQQELLAVLIRATAARQEEQQHCCQDGCGCAPPQRPTPAGSAPHHRGCSIGSAIRCPGPVFVPNAAAALLAEAPQAMGEARGSKGWLSAAWHCPVLHTRASGLWGDQHGLAPTAAIQWAGPPQPAEARAAAPLYVSSLHSRGLFCCFPAASTSTRVLPFSRKNRTPHTSGVSCPLPSRLPAAGGAPAAAALSAPARSAQGLPDPAAFEP